LAISSLTTQVNFHHAFTLAASWAGLARAQRLTTSGSYTGSYANTTVCRYHYGATSVPASAIPTLPYTNSTTGFSQSTKSVTKTSYYTPTPQKTTTITKTSTSTTITGTTTVTSTTTSTFTSYSGSTFTVPTSSGFVPIGKTALSPIPRTTSISSAKVSRRATTSTPPGPTSPTGTQTFTTALFCTTGVVFKPTQVATVTASTKTITRATTTKTTTIVSLTRTQATASLIVTTTSTAFARPTFYAACKSNNIADKVKTYNGTIKPINWFYGWTLAINEVPDAATPYECCVACQKRPGCLGSSWTDASETYGAYEGYFGYSGTLCQLWSTFTATCPPPGAYGDGNGPVPNVPPLYGYDRERGSRDGAVQLSNGNCSPANWIRVRERDSQCGYSDDLYCWRNGFHPGDYS